MAQFAVGLSGDVDGVVIISDPGTPSQQVWRFTPENAEIMAQKLKYYAEKARAMGAPTCQRLPA